MSEFKVGDKAASESFMKLSTDQPSFLSTIEKKAFDTGYHPGVNMVVNEDYKQAQQAQIKTAENTEVMKEEMREIINNQIDYIRMLKEQHSHTTQVLENIFASSEDNTGVQKEMLKIMSEKGINEDLIKDKGMDVFVQGLFTCINILLAKNGINL